jgi:Flp pilus assembly pilin Flp
MFQSPNKSGAGASGATAIEYVFVASLIAIAIVGSLTAGPRSSGHVQQNLQQSEMAPSHAARI